MEKVRYQAASGKITSQDNLFPIHQRDNESFVGFEERRRAMQFNLKEELLRAWIGWVTQTADAKKIHGFRYNKYSCGYVMLCVFLRYALNIYRYPFYEDRMLASLRQHSEIGRELESCISAISKQRFGVIAKEFLELYQHTQAQLSKFGLNVVTLTRKIATQNSYAHHRNVDYGHGLCMAVRAAKVLGKESIIIDMDMLNSFGDDYGYSCMPITLSLDIQAQDVLYCSNLIAPDDRNNSDRRGDAEPGEWVIINRSPTGIVEVPIEAISINESMIQDLPSLSERSAIRFFDSYSPLQLRCAPNVHLYDGLFSETAYRPTLLERFRGAWYILRGIY